MACRAAALALLPLLALAAVAAAQERAPADLPPAAAAALQGIDPARIGAHVRFLADDLLEGRGTGTRGGDIAARYIAAQFALDGLRPAGDDGSYFQQIGFIGSQTLPATHVAVKPAQGAALALKLAEDVVIGNQTAAEQFEVDAPLVYVGYGIDAPEYGWDDFKGIDLHGKIALVLVNEPPSNDPAFFEGAALTYYGRWTYKLEEAARRGAAGALIIHRTDLASYPWEVVSSSWSGEEVNLAEVHEPRLQVAGWVRLGVAERLFAMAALHFDDLLQAAQSRSFRPVELPLRLQAHLSSRVRRFESANVVAELPGSAASPRQAVLYTAHYDHLGHLPVAGGDTIYNGAVDNGTGCGILLELAHAYAGAAVRPAQAVLFVATTAEEKGLLGAQYLARHLPLAAGDIAVDLNFDSVLPLGEPQSLTAAGAERTSLYPLVQQTAAAMQLELEADAFPQAGNYFRADHYSLAQAGVPAFSVNTGVRFAGHTADWGREQKGDYVANRYHRPADRYSADMDFGADATVARFAFALGWQVIAQPQPSGWVAGDPFEAVRQRSQAPPHP